MTIRLLTAYPPYPANAIVTLDAGTEAGLVAAKLAETNTTGGVPYVAPVAPGWRVSAQLDVDSSSNPRSIQGADGLRVPLPGGIIRNVTRDNLARWRKARASVLAGLGRAKIAVIADSTGTGQGGNGVGNNSMASVCLKSWPSMLAKALNNMGVPARFSSTFADQGNTANGAAVTAYDTRVTMSGGWGYTPGFTMNVPGGSALRFASGGASGTWSFQPAEIFDKVDVYYYGSPSNGAFDVNVDGGATIQNISTVQATSGIYKATVTVPRGVHTLGFTPSSTAQNIFILGVDVYDSTKPDVQILNWAQRSAKVDDFVQTTSLWSTLNSYNKFGQDLTLVVLTTNDCDKNTDVATYAAKLELLATTLAAANSDVIFGAGYPGSTANMVNNLPAYIAAMKAVAVKLELPYMSFYERFGSWTDANSRGYMSDSLHATAPCYADAGFMAAQGLALSGDYF